MVISADAVVIGSGAGGGVTAALLAEAGAQVGARAIVLNLHDVFNMQKEDMIHGWKHAYNSRLEQLPQCLMGLFDGQHHVAQGPA